MERKWKNRVRCSKLKFGRHIRGECDESDVLNNFSVFRLPICKIGRKSEVFFFVGSVTILFK